MTSPVIFFIIIIIFSITYFLLSLFYSLHEQASLTRVVDVVLRLLATLYFTFFRNEQEH